MRGIEAVALFARTIEAGRSFPRQRLTVKTSSAIEPALTADVARWLHLKLGEKSSKKLL